MTSEAKKARDEQLIASLVVALVAGHVVGNGAVRVARTPEGRFAVKTKAETLGLGVDDLFDDAHDAVAYYLDLCDPPAIG